MMTKRRVTKVTHKHTHTHADTHNFVRMTQPLENVLAKYVIACQLLGGLKTDTVLILPSSLSSHS